VPDDIRISSSDDEAAAGRSVTWIVEIASQILFSASASVKFELLVGRDERSLDYNFSVVGVGRGQETGQVHDRQEGRRRRGNTGQTKGVYSKSVTLVIDDTDSLWDRPALPTWDGKASDKGRRKSAEPKRAPGGKKKIHLVILTHGLHSNVGADMLYLKESIDATAKTAREKARSRRRAASGAAESSAHDHQIPSTAPLSGGQADIDTAEDSDHEDVVVRGFMGNAVRTENGIRYLGKRLARYILELTYPDQPVRYIKKRSMSQKLSNSFRGTKHQDDGVPTQEAARSQQEDESPDSLAYTFTSISFVGHSLGGLVQLYAIAYIQKHVPKFFEQIQPVNFVALATPFLGLSNENPMYVKFALDFGLVGRSGQDLGLTWRPPTLAKGGWSAVMGFGSTSKEEKEDDPGSKPLLRILPTGPAHAVLRRFRNRTVYSNVVNDGIVPLRTSCLLFLDWRGLDKVEKARRENGLVGRMLGWGWAEVTGQSLLPGGSGAKATEGEILSDTEELSEEIERIKTTVPQPAANAANEDDETQSIKSLREAPAAQGNERPTVSPSTLESILNFLRPSAKATKTDLKMFQRSQTIASDQTSSSDRPESADASSSARPTSPQPPGSRSGSRPPATRGDASLEASHEGVHAVAAAAAAPPKTTIFESAADILSPPTPPLSWLIDPSTRARTIFHDRVYLPDDIPAPRRRGRRGSEASEAQSVGDHEDGTVDGWADGVLAGGVAHQRPSSRAHPASSRGRPPSKAGRPGTSSGRPGTSSGRPGTSSGRPGTASSSGRPTTGTSSVMTISDAGTSGSGSGSGMRVEEKIARAYHRDLSWRKVLVRLEPDAHNNMMVRRMFANAYGWPVVRHLCDAHFGDGALLAAESAAARESAAVGSHVASLDELVDRALEAARPPAAQGKSKPAAPLLQKVDAVPERDTAYLDDSSDDDDEADEDAISGLRARLPRLWSPRSKSPASKPSPNASPAGKPASEAPAKGSPVSAAPTRPVDSAASGGAPPSTVVARDLTESPGVVSDEDRLASALASMQAARAIEEVD
jgi:hypothetical protein